MKTRFAAWLAAGLMLAPAGVQAQAQAPIETTVAVRDLIGQDALAVRARLAWIAADWPLSEPVLTLASDHGVLTYVSSQALIQDPAETQFLARANSGDYSHPVPAHMECRTFIGQSTDPYGVELSLVFTDGRLSQVYRDPPSPPPIPVVNHMTPKQMQALMKSPRPSSFFAAPGQLPLADGDGFMGRWSKQPLAPDTVLTTRCAPWQAPVLPNAHPGKSFNAQGDIALAPLAVFEGPANAARVHALKNGRAVLSQIKLGAVLVQGLDHFAATTDGVRVFREPATDYAVIALDMGALPSTHVDNVDDVAMIGVKGDKVVWIEPSGWRGRSLGLTTDLLCVDDHLVPGRVRPGCGEYGHYQP